MIIEFSDKTLCYVGTFVPKGSICGAQFLLPAANSLLRRESSFSGHLPRHSKFGNRKAETNLGKCRPQIRARIKLSNIELIREYIRARALNPEQILTRESLAEGATTIHTGEELQDYQLRILRNVQRPRPQGYRRNGTKARRDNRWGLH